MLDFFLQHATSQSVQFFFILSDVCQLLTGVWGESRGREPHSMNQQSCLSQKDEGRKEASWTLKEGSPSECTIDSERKMTLLATSVKEYGEGKHPTSHREEAGQWDICRGWQSAGGAVEGDLYSKWYPGGWKISRGDGGVLGGTEVPGVEVFVGIWWAHRENVEVTLGATRVYCFSFLEFRHLNHTPLVELLLLPLEGGILGHSGERDPRLLPLRIGGIHSPLPLLGGEFLNPLPDGVLAITVHVGLGGEGSGSSSPLPLLGWTGISPFLFPFWERQLCLLYLYLEEHPWGDSSPSQSHYNPNRLPFVIHLNESSY